MTEIRYNTANYEPNQSMLSLNTRYLKIDMAKEKKDNHFIKKPYYEGGITAFRQFIKDNLKYPKDALKEKVKGTVLVRYDIDYTGKVTDAKVLKGIGHGCDKEAIRLVKLLKFKVPKGPRKLRVAFHKETKIHFRLPKEKVKKPSVPVSKNSGQMTLSYTIKPKGGKAKTVKKSYNYTINRP